MVRLERVDGIPDPRERLAELSCRPRGNDAPAIEHDDAVTQLECLLGPVGSNEHRTPAARAQFLTKEGGLTIWHVGF